MKDAKKILLCSMLAMLLVAFSGCSKKTDENKSISEIKAEADKMSIEQLTAAAMKYKNAIMAKSAEIDSAMEGLKKVPITDMLGDDVKKLKSEINSLSKAIAPLKERMKIYYDKIKEKGGDASALDI